MLQEETEFEDDVIYGKIKQIQDSLRDPKAEPNDQIDSQVTFNDNSQVGPNEHDQNYDTGRYQGSRPSDVVNFDDKSDNHDATGRSHEPIDLNEITFPEGPEDLENQEQPEHDHSGENFYKNEGSSDKNDGYSENNEGNSDNNQNQEIDLDNARAELQNQIEIIKKKMLHMQRETEKANDISDDQNQDLESDEIRAQQVQQLEEQYQKQAKTSSKKQPAPEPKSPQKRNNKKWNRPKQSIDKKDELKRLMRLYEQKQEIKQVAKQEAKQAPKQRKSQPPASKRARIQAAIIIQKWVKGYYQRKEYEKHRDGIRKIRRLRRFLSVGYKKIKARFIKNVISAVRESGKVVKHKRAQVLKKYRNY